MKENKRTDTKIHMIEILITLDYLLNHTDEEHPATQIKICEYAKKYGIKFDKNEKNNEINRKRISKYLSILKDIADEYVGDVPFVLQQTDGGKYYVEQKHGLNHNQVAKVIAAIKNDKYTEDEKVDELIEGILNAYSTSENNSNDIKEEADLLFRNVPRANTYINKSMRIVNEAYSKNKSLQILYSFIGISRHSNSIAPARGVHYCRVYKLLEYNHHPYAILLPLNKSGIICEKVEKLRINYTSPFMDDDKDRDFDETFRRNNPYSYRIYGSLDNYIEKQVMPQKGFAFKTSFYFDYEYLQTVRASFEEYFSRGMPYDACNSFRIDESKIKVAKTVEIPRTTDEFAISYEALPRDQVGKYCVVNMVINKTALINWLKENPEVAYAVNVVSPKSVNTTLGERFLSAYAKYQDDVSEESFERILRRAKIKKKFSKR